MRNITLGLVITTLFAAAAPAQTTDRVFQFAHTETDQSMNEIATAVRTIGDITNVTVDTGQRSFTVQGTADQIAFASWIFAGLDLKTPVPPDSATHEYRLQSGTDNIVRLYYVDHGQSIQEFQELATAMRTVGDIRRVYTYNAGRTLIVRGTADQIAMCDWYLNEIWTHGNLTGPHAVSNAYQMENIAPPRLNENIVRVFYMAKGASVQAFQELATGIRTIGDVRRVYTYNAPLAMVVRGTADQVALATWLFNEIDQPAAARQSGESAMYKYPVANVPYPVAPDRKDTVRVFYLINARSGQDFQSIATQVRAALNVQTMYADNSARALAVRGTGEQIATAGRLIKQLQPSPAAP
jgi:hypothetical protein